MFEMLKMFDLVGTQFTGNVVKEYIGYGSYLTNPLETGVKKKKLVHCLRQKAILPRQIPINC